MFIENKYYKWYFNIIDNAKSITLSTYHEKHHIIPKCFGGSDGNNIVSLTAKEHFICHRLLTYMTSGKDKCKMSYALLLFTRKNSKHKRNILTPTQYEMVRKQISQAASVLHKGKILSQETKDKISLSKTNSEYIESEYTRTKKSQGTKKMWNTQYEKMLSAHQSVECRTKISTSNTGKTRTDKVKQDISIRNSGTGNGRARSIVIKSPEGYEYNCHGNFQSFCKEHNLPFSSMCHLLQKTRTFTVGATVGWSVEYND